MAKVRQTDPRQFQMFQIFKGHRVSIEKRHILSVDVEDVIGRFFYRGKAKYFIMVMLDPVLLAVFKF